MPVRTGEIDPVPASTDLDFQEKAAPFPLPVLAVLLAMAAGLLHLEDKLVIPETKGNTTPSSAMQDPDAMGGGHDREEGRGA